MLQNIPLVLAGISGILAIVNLISPRPPLISVATLLLSIAVFVESIGAHK